MTHDLVIRNGHVVDGTGAEPIDADVAIDGDRITAIGDVEGRGRREIDADGRLVTPGFVDIHTHLDAQLALGPDRLVVVLARRHVGRARQLRGHVRAVQARRPPLPRRDDGVGRGHPGRLDHGRAGLGLGDLRRVPRRGRSDAQGGQRRRHGRPLRGAASTRWGSERSTTPRRATTDVDAMCELVDGGDRRGGARLLDLPHRAAPGSRRPARSRHLRRSAASCSRSREVMGDRQRGVFEAAAALGERGADGRAPHATRGRDARRAQPPHRPARHVRAQPDEEGAERLHRRARDRRAAERARRRPPSADHRAGHRDPLRPRVPDAVRERAGLARRCATCRCPRSSRTCATPSAGPS